ncbi:uncharacterized protein LOC121653673 isoform X1 [Melanotaenia boesemani]|uniref:uncharacterized protein LOC121653673 isoform X1 n=1 Tax=Melanotaenia boesemani TaxID=1250792 RepID=UPI001C05A911|nr:uncharacterized protein LOC121653673 isoform X1 [Melanotaenia boesemani]
MDRCAPHGTGHRHKVRRWEVSVLTGRQHKLVLPPESHGKKVVFAIGDSHLRSLADGIVRLPEGRLAWGFMSTPGASATELRTEVLHAEVPQDPDLVCVLAPSNDLTAKHTIGRAAADFERYLATVCSRWPKVCVLDFPPRLTVEDSLQELYRQEFHRVAARMAVKYFHIADHFPRQCLNLWSRDGVHLSDDVGMEIFAQLLWTVAYTQLETVPPAPPVSRPSPPSRFTPRVVVKGEVRVRRSPGPEEWTVVGPSGKSSGGCSAVQREPAGIPLNPVLFSSEMLEEMEKVSPSNLTSPADFAGVSPPKTLRVKHHSKRTRRAASSRGISSDSKAALESKKVGATSRHPVPSGRTDETTVETTQSPGVLSSTDEDEATTAKVSEVSMGNVDVVRGSVHQGHSRFRNPGVQCMAIGLVSLARHMVSSVFNWKTEDLDLALWLGDQLYTHLKDHGLIPPGEDFLMIPELPKEHVLYWQNFKFSFPETVSGDVTVTEGEFIECGAFVTLEHGLERMLSQYQTCLLTLCSNTCAVISASGRFAVVDSHSRSATGMVDVNGTSVVLYFGSIREVFDHFSCLAAMFGGESKPFEINGVDVSRECESDDGNKQRVKRQLSADCDEVGLSSPSKHTPKKGRINVSMVVSDEEFAVEEQVLVSRQVSSDVEVVSEGHEKLMFNPLCENTCQRLCTKLNIECESVNSAASSRVGELGVPCQNRDIVADGSCYFRAVSQAVSGTQKHHIKIRRAVVKYLMKNDLKYKSSLREGYSSVADYVDKSKMRYVSSWATELEIQATADLLGINVFTFIGGRWLKYGCSSSCVSEKSIYLENCLGNHYETVVCVKEPKLETCYGYCKVNLSEACRTRLSGKDLIRDASSESDTSVCKKDIERGVYISKYNKVMRRTQIRNMNKIKYALDARHRENVKDRKKIRYALDARHRENVKDRKKIRYALDARHRENMKDRRKVRYVLDARHCENVKDRKKIRYAKDARHRENQKDRSKIRYAKDARHRENQKDRSKIRYAKDARHRENQKDRSKIRYAKDSRHREIVKRVVKSKRQEIKDKDKTQNIEFFTERFLNKVEHGPEYICCVCFRLLFPHQVLSCRKDAYNKTAAIASLADRCIRTEYLHKCREDCVQPCQIMASSRGHLWICYTCHHKISHEQMPAESVTNHLVVDPVPPELACLNRLEQHLIALNIPFMKMLALPKGGQNGVHGPVTCVPSNVVQTSKMLPRSNMEGSLLAVKLKRKLTYKGHYQYEFVDTMHIRQALRFLKQSNKFYKDIDFNEEWVNELCVLEQPEDEEKDNAEVVESTGDDVEDDELLHDRQQHCMFSDTCLMPVDIGQEVLDQYFDSIVNVAPAEGNNPVKLLTDRENEARCFPVLFPRGRNMYHESRVYNLSLCRYFNNRILHADRRFAQNVEYIFFAQYMSEVEQVVSKVSIALRKGKGGEVSVEKEESLKQLLDVDDGFRFLKPIRGTPAFWQGVQKDLMACVRQLGIPTWFCSFSSADLRWQNLLKTILKQEGRTQTFEELEWTDRCDLLRRNPVTAARMFDFRWHCFLKEVLMSSSNPIGKIIDYFYRVEFQCRGSPHVHCLFWIENAPKINTNKDEEVVAFIDKYVTCELPAQDETLLEMVTSVQQHSKRHSKSCKKGGTECRFNFPRPVSARTFLVNVHLKPDCDKCKNRFDEKYEGKQCTCGNQYYYNLLKVDKDLAVRTLESVKKALKDENKTFNSLDELFHSLNINQQIFEICYKRLNMNKTQIVYKRDINEAWINPYNKSLLKCWNANLDIQFVTDAYAVIVYIISYISKSEKEVGLLLSKAHKEATKDDNVSAKEALKQIGSVYLNSRDVSAQEAVYRLTGMHLKENSRKVEFIPTGDKIVKMSKPISVIQECGLTGDDVWMVSIVDRYRSRPNNSTFNDMCIATFVSEYRLLNRNEKSKNAIQLQRGLGLILKRTRTKPAVVRYARFSKTKNPELYFKSQLQLFLPYRVEDDLKAADCETFEQFYENGSVIFSDGSEHTVKSVVDTNRNKFEVEDSEELEELQKKLENEGGPEVAWGNLCPEKELERLECQEEIREKEQTPAEDAEEIGRQPVDNIPDLAVRNDQVCQLEKNNNVISRREGLELIRSLNEKQLSVFYKIRNWCLDKVNGRNPEPLHVFISGGAGVGKSYLVKAIQYEATRLLSPSCQNPDNICVLLTAPTGIAAYNLKAATIHSTFGIGKDVSLPYTPLSEEKLNSLRVKYSDLQIVIIDEISMVNHNLLAYVHGRLRQIKQTGDYNPFGNVSIIAVGDFYQLPPVKGKALYVQDVQMNLWSSLFELVELKTIVRQKDEEFARILNRMRTHRKGTPMLADDINVLKQCETGEESTALHIFATNSQVDEYNEEQLMSTCPDHIVITAQDFGYNKKTGKLELKPDHHIRAKKTALQRELLLGKNARVMLSQNIDVNDGLVNGVCGTVIYIEEPEKNTFPLKVYVKFDDDKVGIKTRKQTIYPSAELKGSVPIEPQEERANKKGMRRQFPLKLAWACTVHKVQGLTVDSAVVSLAKVFAPGQAYVALSRVRSLSGLIIQDFKEKAVYCNANIEQAIANMPPFITESHTVVKEGFRVFLMNVQSLNRHVSDLAHCAQHLQPNCIAVTETWIPADVSLDSVEITGYRFSNAPRSLAYHSDNPVLISLKGQQHGGVGMYCDSNAEFESVTVAGLNIECLAVKCVTYNILIAAIYRPPSYPVSLFFRHFEELLNVLESQSGTIVVLGDFNEDILKSSTICQKMTDRGYEQHVSTATTEKGTLIDHVYVKNSNYRVEALVVPTYFSDHEGIICSFK